MSLFSHAPPPLWLATGLLALGGVGCVRGKITRVAEPDSGPVVAGQMGKDETIVAEAAKIDAITPDARPHTDAQRAAVAAAPAADVSRIVAQYEAALKDRNATVAKLTRERDEARNATDKAILIGGYALAGILCALGVASFFLASQVPWLGPRISIALVAASVSIFAMLQAYQWTKAHPWITGVTLLFLVAAGALAYANHHHAKDPAP